VRVAAVDLGTNSTRLLVADLDDGRLDDVVRRLKITRLGEGVDERKSLLPAPIARVRNVLVDFRREIQELGAERTLLVATSAVRDAENGASFLDEVERSYGFETRLLTGDDEALMTRRGVASGRELDAETLIVDIGGGSTELTLDDFHVSLDIGSVRLTERFLRSDPPTRDELDAAARAARDALPDVGPRTAIGVAGTITTIAALAWAMNSLTNASSRTVGSSESTLYLEAATRFAKGSRRLYGRSATATRSRSGSRSR